MKDTTKKAILAGGSGFLGTALAERLNASGWQVVVLTRNPDAYKGRARAVAWNGQSSGDWESELDGAAALVNLTGKSVNSRPTRANRREILSSRVDSVKVLGEAVRKCAHPPDTWIQASSLAIYGNTGENLCLESAPPATGYPADVCSAWEDVLKASTGPGMRPVVLRIGIVLGRDGGALPFLATLVKWGLGGTVGNGKQWFSWLHLDDMVRIFLAVLENKEYRGAYNVAAPNAVRNRDLMRNLRALLKRPWSPPAPVPAVWLGSWLLGTDPKLALTGRRCQPRRLTEAGFEFTHTDLETALRDLLGPRA